ncbi:MAG: hypothetical protein J7500_10495 [Sphingomonas sp.]|uniref:hypothetical protein n=1 Tax=Sphingomonas sp. TaxID=28214 RepID=UPI001B114E01|nr:hypothetical protein [Sphingomonas sp.]MBO9623128.1 hypothetical protein [Sphingomonas sp.]
MFGTLLLLLAATQSQAAADPLASAREGKIQCIQPNKEKKTCLGLASLTVRPDGSFDSVARVMIAPTPAIVMETRSSGKAEGDALCAVIRQQDYANARITIEGAPADAATGDAIRGQLVGAVAPLDGKKACSRAVPEGDVLRLDVTVEGTARPDLTRRAIWVRPDEGYKLGM